MSMYILKYNRKMFVYFLKHFIFSKCYKTLLILIFKVHFYKIITLAAHNFFLQKLIIQQQKILHNKTQYILQFISIIIIQIK